MPFTFSHPAAVLPLSYIPLKWRSVTGLVIGSMTPDFEKFFRMRAYDAYSHTWESIFYFNLPVALLLSFAFHVVVRDQLIDNLPTFLKKRFIIYKNFDWKEYFKQHYGLVIFSILAGVFSHLFWDAFTHHDGRFLHWLPFLNTAIHIEDYSISIFNFLQFASTLAGGFIVFLAILLLPCNKIPAYNSPHRYWVPVFLLMSLIILIRFEIGWTVHYLANIIVTIISALLLSLFIISYLRKKDHLLETQPPQ